MIHTSWKTTSPLHLVFCMALNHQGERKIVLCLQTGQERKGICARHQPSTLFYSLVWNSTMLPKALYLKYIHIYNHICYSFNISASKPISFQLNFSITFWENLRKLRKYIKSTKINYISLLPQYFSMAKLKPLSSGSWNP